MSSLCGGDGGGDGGEGVCRLSVSGDGWCGRDL